MKIGIVSLIVYIVLIFVLNIGLKRKMAEALMWSFFALVIISFVFGGKNPAVMFLTGVVTVVKQEVTFAVIAFMIMSLLMAETGIMGRLIKILNHIFGRIPGGPAYVSTIASALFGMVSGSGSGNSSSVGSITIPWMVESGFSKERATTIVAGNAGLGVVFPPSSSMLLLLGMEVVRESVSSNSLYIALMLTGLIVLVYRLLLTFLYVKKDKIRATVSDGKTFSEVFKENGSSLLLFLGIIIPLLVQMGPLATIIKTRLNANLEGSYDSISLVVWIPIMMTIFVIIEGWSRLPHSFKGWSELLGKTIVKCADAGIIVFAIASVGVLNRIGMQQEFVELFTSISGVAPIVLILAIALLMTLMVGPFSATASTTAMGAVCYSALVSIGVSPLAACTAFLLLASNEGCVPPNSAPIYIASGIAGLDEPFKTFKNLLLHYTLPVVLIAILIMCKILPVFGA